GEVLAIGRTHQAGLHDVRQFGRAVEQDGGLVGLTGGGVFQQFRPYQLGARGVEGQAQYIGADHHLFGLGGRRRGGRPWHCAGRGGRGRRRWHRGRGRLAVGAGLLRGRFGAGPGGGRAEQRRLAVLDLPVVPQEQQRKRE